MIDSEVRKEIFVKNQPYEHQGTQQAALGES